jgi:hypothetical protein
MHTHHTTQPFPTHTTDLEPGTPPEIVDIPDGGAFELRIAPVAKRLGDATVRMLAYNGSRAAAAASPATSPARTPCAIPAAPLRPRPR